MKSRRPDDCPCRQAHGCRVEYRPTDDRFRLRCIRCGYTTEWSVKLKDALEELKR